MSRVVHGFTLIELMIVIFIFGVMASIALPAYNDYVDRSNKQSAWIALSSDLCKVNESEFANAVGGMAIGSALTAEVAGNSFIIVMTNTGLMVGTAAAVAPSLVAAATTTAVAYTAVKSFCGASKHLDFVYPFVVEQTSKTFEIIGDAAGGLRKVVLKD